MKAQELRIGNYLQDFGGNIAQVIHLTKDKIILESPITLTEEWLLKFGFSNGISKGGFTFDKCKLSIHLKSYSYPNGRTYFNSWCILEKQIEYVHQLQNLYFALTDEELTINQ
jgi:hypothetical protein